MEVRDQSRSKHEVLSKVIEGHKDQQTGDSDTGHACMAKQREGQGKKQQEQACRGSKQINNEYNTDRVSYAEERNENRESHVIEKSRKAEQKTQRRTPARTSSLHSTTDRCRVRHGEDAAEGPCTVVFNSECITLLVLFLPQFVGCSRNTIFGLPAFERFMCTWYLALDGFRGLFVGFSALSRCGVLY